MTCPAILVTGGAGFIGSHTCKALALAGFLPVTYDDLSLGHRWAVRHGPLETGCITDSGRLAEVMRRHSVTAVIHLASLSVVAESMAEPERYWRVNVGGALALLDAMRQTGTGALVVSSSASVYGGAVNGPISEAAPIAPDNTYGSTKAAMEFMMRDFTRSTGLRGIALRYFNAAGADPDGELGEAHQPETHLIPLAIDAALGRRPPLVIHGTDFPTPDGTAIRDFVHVADLALGHVLALKRVMENDEALFDAFNLGTGHGHSVLDVIRATEQVTGRPLPSLQGPRRPGDPAMLVADSRRIQSELGWQPAHPGLSEQIAHAWAWRSQTA